MFNFFPLKEPSPHLNVDLYNVKSLSGHLQEFKNKGIAQLGISKVIAVVYRSGRYKVQT